MLRIEAFPYMDAAVVRVTGICTGKSHGGPVCEGHSLVTQVSVDALEAMGVELAVWQGVRALLSIDPNLAGFVMH